MVEDQSTHEAVTAQGGTLTVADAVVNKVAAHAAGQVPGVVARGGRSLAKTYPAVTSEVGGGRASIRVEIALAWPWPAAATAAQVRDAVGSAVNQFAGVSADRVDVAIAALATYEGSGRRVR